MLAPAYLLWRIAVFRYLAPLVLLLLLVPILHAEVQKVTEDKTLSPYFLVKGDTPATEQLPLESTTVAANIAGVIADVRVTQVYKNAGATPIEAIYVFPASTRAAVYGLQMTIGARTITAQIKEKAQARADYEQARARGQSASLLEQERPNVFQMNVANILPGDVIQVELRYTELLVPNAGEYEFVYPTVVGPRYAGAKPGQTPPGQNWVQNPYLGEGVPPSSTLNLNVQLATGVPLQAVASPSHLVEIRYEGRSNATVVLAERERHGGNRDFSLRYRLSGDAIETGVLLYQGATPQEENFFLAMLQPPKRVATEAMPARDYLFIVDVSGSMYGFPLNTAKQLLKALLGQLRPHDTFNILLFSGGSEVLAPQSLPASARNIQAALRLLDGQQGSGSTELLPALQRALSLPRPDGLARSAIIVTDGYVTVETEAFDLIRQHLNQLNVFAFGIGSSVNRHLIEGLAHVGQGEPFIITQPSEAAAQAARFRTYIEAPVLTGVTVAFQGLQVQDVEPLTVPDVFAQRPVLVYGKWQGQPQGEIILKGHGGQGPVTLKLALDGIQPRPAHAALRYLWARERLRTLSDYNELRQDAARVKTITELALRYNLLSQYTSFVAIDSEVRRKPGETLETVEQPLPLPEGVSEYALAGKGLAYTAPAPVSAAPDRWVSNEADTGQLRAFAPPSPRQVYKLKAQEREQLAQAEPKPAVPAASALEVHIGGTGLDVGTVRQVVLSHTAALEALLTHVTELEIRFTVSHLGKVSVVQLVSGSLAPEVLQQLQAAVSGWRFPPFASPTPVPVRLVLRFDAQGKLQP